MRFGFRLPVFGGWLRNVEDVGVDLLLLRHSPQLEEMERFAEEVIPLVNGRGWPTYAPAPTAARSGSPGSG